MTAFPNIDPRVKAWGVSKLREFDADTLRDTLTESIVILKKYDEPIAVLISYENYMQLQADKKEEA